MQLGAYARRFSGDRNRRLVTLSDSTERWAREVLPADVAGVPVEHWSWDDVRDLVRTAKTHARGTERFWLDQLEEYMGEAAPPRRAGDAPTDPAVPCTGGRGGCQPGDGRTAPT